MSYGARSAIDENDIFMKELLALSDGLVTRVMRPLQRRRVSISPHGERTYTDLPMHTILHTELKLPSLQERASRSTIPGLYEMSKELLGIGDDENDLAKYDEQNGVEFINTDTMLTDVDSQKIVSFYKNQLEIENQTDLISNSEILSETPTTSTKNLNSVDAELSETDTMLTKVDNPIMPSKQNEAISNMNNNDAVETQFQLLKVNEENYLDSSSAATVKFMPTTQKRVVRRKKKSTKQQKKQKSKYMENIKRSVKKAAKIKREEELKNKQPVGLKSLKLSIDNYFKSAFGNEYTISSFLISLLIFFLIFAYACFILRRGINNCLHRKQEYRKLVTQSGIVLKIYYYFKNLLKFSDGM